MSPKIVSFGLLLCALTTSLFAQQTAPPQPQGDNDAVKFLKGVYVDQKHIWTSPFRLTLDDAKWMVPFAGITAGLIATDRTASLEATHSLRLAGKKPSTMLSNAGVAGMVGIGGGMYLLGVERSDDKMRETGLLSGEAAADAFAVDEVLKFAIRRDRPTVDESGPFFQPGGSSFPSAHAATSFAIASVIAHEYPGWLTQLVMYGGATAISALRVREQQHFPSDVFIGATAGYLIGRSVYKMHGSDDEGVPLNIGTFDKEAAQLDFSQMSSPYIPLDDPIYQQMERLAARGVVRSPFLNLRPWTVNAVRLMLADATAPDDDPASESELAMLQKRFPAPEDEFGGEEEGDNQSIAIDALYERSQYISGAALTDGFHFGQTIQNDFGRRDAAGFQQIAGFETHANAGRFTFAVRGEWQHLPGIPAPSATVQSIIAAQDATPLVPGVAVASSDPFRLLEAYVNLRLGGNDISIGKQSLWWGPSDSGSLILSDNAEPFYAVRWTRNTPLEIPLLSKLIGPVRYDSFFGHLQGNQYPRNPFMYGNKISFDPTENLEFGFSRDAIFGGYGFEPLTFGNLWHSFTSTTSATGANFDPRRGAGARHAQFDFSYRLPYLRKYVTLYTDSAIHDDVSPIDAPRHAMVLPGIYIAQFPGARKLDLHVEGGTSNPDFVRAKGGRYYYYELLYKDGYTNKKQLLASWLNREGTGVQAWSTYWLRPDRSVVVGFRDLKTSQYFVPSGGTQQDFYAKAKMHVSKRWDVNALVQYEKWYFPAIAPRQNDVTTQIELRFHPEDWKLTSKPR